MTQKIKILFRQKIRNNRALWILKALVIRVKSCFVLIHLFIVNNVRIVYNFKEEVKEFHFHFKNKFDYFVKTSDNIHSGIFMITSSILSKNIHF